MFGIFFFFMYMHGHYKIVQMMLVIAWFVVNIQVDYIWPGNCLDTK